MENLDLLINGLDKEMHISSPRVIRGDKAYPKWLFRLVSKESENFENRHTYEMFKGEFGTDPSFLIFGGDVQYGLLASVSQLDKQAIVYKDSHRKMCSSLADFVSTFLMNRGYTVKRRDYLKREKMKLPDLNSDGKIGN